MLRRNDMPYRINYHDLPNGSVEVSCPDIPEFFIVQPSRQDAKAFAKAALPVAMHNFYRKKHRRIPTPTKGRCDDRLTLPVRIQAKILLWNYMLENRWRLSELAKMLGVSQTQAQRLVDLDRDLASMEAIEAALEKLDASFRLTVR
ncbi:hypothetical protein MAF45_08435 [Mesosutterella sp. OilRF-GAM-744-9]|uniref:Antitoxin HicB n=1 Tax=Mesosutterella porci TaxID=2915351 RepID=A0ABS9MS68_9BURK|nr:hypothetical protein [Mesosutterella sp. oilRF-744-WT-GAM-9]MCG5031466.1 hypothetical protein [Mesosutterella sp. oilRF-744-WT-GAM-9]MCI6530289.1 hypothetical protein [Mesosutterella sp.]